MRKKLPGKDQLAAYLAAGKTVEQIAAKYDCKPKSARRKLRDLGLTSGMTGHSHSHHVERRMKSMIDCAPEPGVILKEDRITFNREMPWQGTGSRIRPLSLPRPSMYLAAIASKYPNLQGDARV